MDDVVEGEGLGFGSDEFCPATDTLLGLRTGPLIGSLKVDLLSVDAFIRFESSAFEADCFTESDLLEGVSFGVVGVLGALGDLTDFAERGAEPALVALEIVLVEIAAGRGLGFVSTLDFTPVKRSFGSFNAASGTSGT